MCKHLCQTQISCDRNFLNITIQFNCLRMLKYGDTKDIENLFNLIDCVLIEAKKKTGSEIWNLNT